MFFFILALVNSVTNSLSGISAAARRVFEAGNDGGWLPRSPFPIALFPMPQLSIFRCAVAQLAEPPFHTRKVPGSRPGSTTMEVMPIGEGLVLNAGSGASAMQIRVRATSVICTSSSVAEHAPFKRLIGSWQSLLVHHNGQSSNR